MIALLLMLAIFGLLTFWLKLPRGIALFLSGVLGTFIGGYGLAFRDWVEGMFVFFDPILIVCTALLFLKSLEQSGTLGFLRNLLLHYTAKSPAAFLLAMVFFLMLPGAMTGLSSAAVLTTGALAAPLFIERGLTVKKTGALIALLAIFGMIAPPINLPVMMLANGVDMPFIGFEKSLLMLTLPPALITAFGMAYGPLLRYKKTYGTLLHTDTKDRFTFSQWLSLFPLLMVSVYILVIRLFPNFIHDIGVPAVFLFGTLLSIPFIPSSKRLETFQLAYRSSLPVIAILVGIGVFLQTLALIGARGDLVVSTLLLPLPLLPIGAAIVMPFFGALSAFGSATVLGVPILLAMLGKNEIVVGAALSLFAGLGDMMPPTALAGTFAAEVVGEKNYLALIRPALPYIAIGLVWGLLVLWNAGFVSQLLGMVQ
ncbi:MAG: TRAP transporter large permease subunit [bacterium]|nr:TRAP transporter large permease subunit [bacterium]